MLSLPFKQIAPVFLRQQGCVQEGRPRRHGAEKTGRFAVDVWQAEGLGSSLFGRGVFFSIPKDGPSWVQVREFSAPAQHAIGTQRKRPFRRHGHEFRINSPQHEACSRCGRLVKGGWFTLRRRTKPSARFFSGRIEAHGSPRAGERKRTFAATRSSILGKLTALSRRRQGRAAEFHIGGGALGHERQEAAGVQGRDEVFSYLSSTGVRFDWHQIEGLVPIPTPPTRDEEKGRYYEKVPGADSHRSQLTTRRPPNSKGRGFGPLRAGARG